MMEQFGTVLESRDGKARVLVRRPGACEHCGGCELGASPEQVIELDNPQALAPGTPVRLLVAPGEVAKASVVIYVLPLVALFAGFGAGQVLGRILGYSSELFVLFVGLLSLAAAYGLIFAWDRRRRHSRCTPVMEAADSASGDPRLK